MNRRTVSILRFLLAAAIVATLTILIIRGRDPTFLSFRTRPHPETELLGKMIVRVEFHETPFHQAVADLGRQAGVRIEFDEAVTRARDYDRPVNFSADHITLGDALTDLMAVGSTQPLTCVPRAGGLRIAYANAAQEPLFFYEYGFSHAPRQETWFGSSFTISSNIFVSSFRSALPVPRPSLPPLYDDNITALAALACPDGDRNVYAPPGVDFSPHMFLLQTASAHQRFRDILEALRPGASPNARRALPFGTEVLDFANGAFHARDSSAANDALRRAVPVINIPFQPLDKALASLSAQVGVPIVLTEGTSGSFPSVNLYQGQDSLGFAIETLLRRADWTDHKGFRPDRDTIWISSDLAPMCFRLYELEPYFSRFPEEERGERANLLIAAVRPSGGDARFLGSMLVISGGWFVVESAEPALLKFLKGDPVKIGSNGSR
jgi:hypothetical protein